MSVRVRPGGMMLANGMTSLEWKRYLREQSRSVNGSTTKAKVKRLKKVALKLVGSRCIWCGSKKVQMAHILPTPVLKHRKGSRGVGEWQRWNDIAKHPDCYRPMCQKHHRMFDNLVNLIVPEEPIPF